MALKKIINLTEGPIDYLRGAARQVAPAARQIQQAGQAQSLVGNLDSAVKRLAALMQNIVPKNRETATPPTPSQYATPSSQRAQAAGTTAQMPTRPQVTFASYIQTVVGDQLNEGPMDFIKGAANMAGRAAMNQVRKRSTGYVDVKGFLDKMDDKAARFAAGGQRQQILNQIQTIRQLVAQFPNQSQAATRVKARLRQFLGKVPAERVYAMVFPPQVSQQTSTSWKQQGQPAAQPAAPKRQYGPGRRRSRPQSQ